MAVGLQVDEAHRVTGLPRRLSHQLETKWLQAQEDLRVHSEAQDGQLETSSMPPLGNHELGADIMNPCPWQSPIGPATGEIRLFGTWIQ